ncbi:MAG: hypothetical protein ACK4NB_06830, partial [Fimbriimonadales bacterium]
MLGVLIGLVLIGLVASWGGRVMRSFTPNLLEQLAFGGALALGVLAYSMAGASAIGLADDAGATISL